MTPFADLIIGLDCSTTACKAVVWDSQGNSLASSRSPLPVLQPYPSWHEQSASSWWEAAVSSLRDAVAGIDPQRIAGLSIAAQRETFVLTDLYGNPLHNALLWMDERCRNLLPEIAAIYGENHIHQISGKPLSGNLTLGKLLWLKKNRPDLCIPSTRVNDVHAFLSQRLTGRFATSWGCADPTGLFDMQNHRWNANLIQAIGFQPTQFPEALPPTSIIGQLLSQPARECGLPPGLPLVAGLGDGQAAGLGVNVTRAGEAYLNLGTAVVSGAFSEHYLVDRAFRTMYSGTPETYILETVLLGGTYTINWFLEKFSGTSPDITQENGSLEEIFEKKARSIPPGSLGLTLVPYWNSAMNPYWDAAASGIIVGWRGIHEPAHLYRSILEGIAFEQRLHTRGVEAALGSTIERYIAVGGGARSDLWCQIISDITDRPVFRANAPEATALGAGILSAAGVSLFPDTISAAHAMTSISETCFFPDATRAAFYNHIYEEVYKNLFPVLQEYLDRIADLTIIEREA